MQSVPARTTAQPRPVTSCGSKFRLLQRTGTRRWSVTSFGVQSVYYWAPVLQNCGLPCCAVQGTRGSVFEGSYPVSDSFSALVLNSGQWQVPDASFASFNVQVPNSGQLQASVCRGASCDYYFTRVFPTAVCCARNQRLSLRGQAVR